jgi:hypothetical protein
MALGCIYCGSRDFDKEHGLPRCLGNFQGYSPLVDRVCSGCNNSFKVLDEQLCRSGGEAFFREYLGIKGRRGQKKVSPFYRGSAGGQLIQVETTSPDDGRPIALEVSNGAARELRHVSLVAENGTRHVIPIPEGMTQEQFRARFDSLGIGSVREGHAYADESEVEWVRHLMASLGPDVNVQWDDDHPLAITYPGAVITFTVTERYFRAIAKIGFHCFLGWVPRFRGDEDCFRDIREFIKTEGTIERCDRFVSAQSQSVIYRGWRPANWGHLVTAEVDYLRITSRVQLFLGPESLPALYVISLGRNASHIHYREAEVRFFEYLPREERGDFDGELKTGFAVRGLL